MNLSLTSLLISCALSSVVVAQPLSLNDATLKSLELLQTKTKLNRDAFSYPKNLGNFAIEDIKARLGYWTNDRLNQQDRFEVLKTFKRPPFAGVIAVSAKKNTPFDLRVQPMCFIKEGEKWKLAPMISNFSYAATTLDEQKRQLAGEVETWLNKHALESYDVALRIKRKEFQSRVDLKKKEVANTCKNSTDLLDYFFEQLDEKSLEGLCAATGYDSDEQWSTGQDSKLLLRSLIFATQKGTQNKRVWNVVSSSDYLRKVVNSEHDDSSGHDALAVAFIATESSQNDGRNLFGKSTAYQMTVFNVNWQPGAHLIRLPSALLISEDEEKSNSFDERFERWALDNKMQAIWDKVPQLVFKASQGNYCKSIEALKIRLRKAREENDFSEWLKCHTPTNKLAKEKYDGYLQAVCSSWKAAERAQSNSTIDFRYSKDKQSAVALSLILDFGNMKGSNVSFVGYHQNAHGWGVVIKPDQFAASYPELKKLVKGFGETDQDVITKYLATIRKQITLVDPQKISKRKLPKKSWVEGVSLCLASIKEADMQAFSRLVCSSTKEDDSLLDKLGILFELYSGSEDLKVKEVVMGDHGVASVLVERKENKELKYMHYFMVNTDEGVRLDIQHHISVDSSSRLASILNRTKWKMVQKSYPSDAVSFFKKNHEHFGKVLKPF